MPTEPPDAVVEEALRLTRLARAATDEQRAVYRRRRSDLLADYGYVARVRAADDGREPPGATAASGPDAGTPGGRDGAVLVVHPSEWVDDGTIRVGRIDDLSRAVERPLDDSKAEDWRSVETHNREIAARVERDHGPVHGATAHAFADFLGNHYVRTVENAITPHVAEFLDEYFPRNAWPSTAQRAAVGESLALVFDTAGVDDPPLPGDPSGESETSAGGGGDRSAGGGGDRSAGGGGDRSAGDGDDRSTGDGGDRSAGDGGDRSTDQSR